MKALMNINMENAAFDNPNTGSELARILRNLAAKVTLKGAAPGFILLAEDSNGHVVGSLKIQD